MTGGFATHKGTDPQELAFLGALCPYPSTLTFQRGVDLLVQPDARIYLALQAS